MNCFVVYYNNDNQ